MPVKLSFGTAGIRARAGEGDDQLNTRTVEAVAHVLCSYVAELAPGAQNQGVCIGYDGRKDSQRFARSLAGVALGHGYKVRCFERPTPTPLLAFATKHHAAALGLMVTASHNPPEDNGIKVYWQGGAQILSPHDTNIAQRLQSFDNESPIPRADIESARASGRYTTLGAAETESYLDAVLALATPSVDLPAPKLAYSALYGVGSAMTHGLLARAGVAFLELAQQATPLPDLGGLRSPNPEHDEALVELRRFADATGAELACCHDPDADRLAVLTRDDAGALVRLSGDELGALFVDCVLAQDPAPQSALVVSTFVSSSLAERVAQARGASFLRTPTGFKWIASQGRLVSAQRSLRFVFGYEEALGYCFPGMADDKDGIAALHVLLQFARTLKAQGQSLWQRLEQLQREHGLLETRQVTLSASGAQGLERMRALMDKLRRDAPETWLGPGASREDALAYTPASDLLIFRTPHGTRLCARPSGTEPKLKFYLEAQASVASTEPMASARTRVASALDDLAARIQRVGQA